MFPKKWRWAFWVIVVVLVLRWWLGRDTDADVSRPNALLTNRPWFERTMKSPRDRVHGLMLFDKRRLGGVSYSSAFLFHAEVVRWSVKGDELQLDYLQEKKRTKSRYKVWRCKDAPKPFELCLELRQGLKVTRFYSMEKKQDAAQMEALIESTPDEELSDESFTETSASWWP